MRSLSFLAAAAGVSAYRTVCSHTHYCSACNLQPHAHQPGADVANNSGSSGSAMRGALHQQLPSLQHHACSSSSARLLAAALAVPGPVRVQQLQQQQQQCGGGSWQQQLPHHHRHSPSRCSSNCVCRAQQQQQQQQQDTVQQQQQQQQQQAPDWSQSLLKLAQPRKKKRKGGDGSDSGGGAEEVFFGGGSQQQLPWDAAGGFDGDDDDTGEDAFGSSSGSAGGRMLVEKKKLPAAVRCFDTARIYVKGGDGGAGCVAFRREPYVEKGGPNGGNGGKGGNVWAVADEGMNSLLSFRNQLHYRAGNGYPGQGSFRDGGDGTDCYIRVPVGTIVRRKEAEEDEPAVAELLEAGQKALLVVGGRGGRGNHSFKTRMNTAPTLAERGEAGYEEWLDLELKVVADVGIVGVPNAGKSTLLAVLSAARPKIANYPFTTLVPNLGVCEMDFRTTVFADVPGLLEGAHEGHGLGHAFLRHISRCRVLLHVLDGTSPDPVGDYKAIQLELELFNPALLEKPQVIAYNKVDLPDSGDYWEFVKEYLRDEEGIPEGRLFPISAVTGRGVREAVQAVRGVLDELGPQAVQPEVESLNLTEVPRRFAPEARIDKFTVEADPNQLPGGTRLFVVQGDAIERFAQMTNWDYYEAVKRFQRVLEVSGINEALKAAGIATGDTVALGDSGEFVWSDDQSEGASYGAWLEDMASRGKAQQGSARWPTPR